MASSLSPAGSRLRPTMAMPSRSSTRSCSPSSTSVARTAHALLWSVGRLCYIEIVADTHKIALPSASARGEEARAARAKLARSLLLALGASADVADAGANEASDDGQFLDDIVTSLVDDGVVSLA